MGKGFLFTGGPLTENSTRAENLIKFFCQK